MEGFSNVTLKKKKIINQWIFLPSEDLLRLLHVLPFFFLFALPDGFFIATTGIVVDLEIL